MAAEHRRMTPLLLARLKAARRAGTSWAEIARQLGDHDWHSLASFALRYPGMSQTKARRRGHLDPEKVRRLAEQGLSRPRIAALLGTTRGNVDRALRRLGLRTDGCHAQAHRQRARRLTLDRGPNSPLGQRLRAAQLGWPQAESRLEAHILAALYERGPLTRLELSHALGLRRHERRMPPHLEGPLLALRQRGLVQIAGHGPGTHGRRPYLLALAQGVLPHRPKRERGERTATEPCVHRCGVGT